jgi:hypothetical protein
MAVMNIHANQYPQFDCTGNLACSGMLNSDFSIRRGRHVALVVPFTGTVGRVASGDPWLKCQP